MSGGGGAVAQGVDIHTHVVPERFPPYAGKGLGFASWPSMADADACHKHVMISGKVYRTVAQESWNAARRIDDMGAAGIGLQALSPMPELLSYWLPVEDARVLNRYLNEQIGEMVARAPERFVGLGAVPLQDVEAAIRELEFVMTELKFAGVEIATHVNGASIGEPRFRPFFAAAEALGAAVFVHALRPAGVERLVGPPALEQIAAFPGEVALAIAAMMTGGTLEAHPRLRIAFSHAGGAFALLLPRLEHGWRRIPDIGSCMARAPREYARRIYVDSLTYDPDALRFVLESFGTDRVMLGTDYPFRGRDPAPQASLDALELDESVRAAIEHGNALAFLGVGAVTGPRALVRT